MKIAYIFFLIFIFSGCDLILSPQGESVISLISEQQEFIFSEEIALHLENNAQQTLFLNYCGPVLLFLLERRENENWVVRGAAICLALYEPGFSAVLEPGQSKVIEVYVEEPGVYRYSLSYKLGSIDTKKRTITAEFTVVEK